MSLLDMARECDESQGIIHRGKFYVIGGYHTSMQGRFGCSAEEFNVTTWQLHPVEENFLNPAMCPKIVWMVVTCCICLVKSSWSYEKVRRGKSSRPTSVRVYLIWRRGKETYWWLVQEDLVLHIRVIYWIWRVTSGKKLTYEKVSLVMFDSDVAWNYNLVL